MLIRNITWQSYRLPFVGRFSTAHGTLAAREGAIVVLRTTQDGIGLGEVAPFPGMSRETLAEALGALNALIPRLRGMTLEAALALLEREWETLPASTICGVEMAICDVGGRFIAPVATYTGAMNRAPTSSDKGAMNRAPTSSDKGAMNRPPTSNETGVINRAMTVAVNAVIGARTTADAVKAAIVARQDGFACVKLKVGVCEDERDERDERDVRDVQQEIARIAAVRAALGPDIAMRLDANEAWSLEQAHAVLAGCVPYDIQYVEQPLPASEIEAMRLLRTSVGIALAADEGVRDILSARLLLEREAVDVLILKPQLIGGLRACRLIVDEATRRGVACVLTTTIESGVSVAATLQLVSSLPEVTLACGLGTLPLLIDDLINEHLSIKNGFMDVPSGPGWGVTLDEAAMRRYS